MVLLSGGQMIEACEPSHKRCISQCRERWIASYWLSLCIRIQRILLCTSEPWSKCSDGSQVWSCFCIIFIYPFLFKFVKIDLLALKYTNKMFTQFTLIATHYFDRATSSLSCYSNQKEMTEPWKPSNYAMLFLHSESVSHFSLALPFLLRFHNKATSDSLQFSQV